jgi:hypothetical protein
MSDLILDRLDTQRRQTVRAGITGAISCLTAPDVTEAQRAAWGESYMQCVVAQLNDLDRRIDDRVWSLLTKAVAA